MSVQREHLKITSTGLSGKLLNFIGKSGEYWISIIPSLNVTGYGNSESDAHNDLAYNLKVFCQDIFELSQPQRDIEFNKLGWNKSKYFKKKYSSAFVDEKGVLRNFDSPKDVKKTVLEPANM